MKAVNIINGPSINMLEHRNKKIYGSITLPEIERLCIQKGKELNLSVKCFQFDSEAEIIKAIHASRDNSDGVILNAAAYTHTSVAILDALLSIDKPCIEVHLSNLLAREEFRKQSYTANACVGIIMGFGHYSYILAVEAMNEIIKKPA